MSDRKVITMMKNNHMPIDEVISKLGYAESKNLIYFHNDLSAPLTLHDKKMISELKPYAYYLVDNKPFILFYERQLDRDIAVKDISRPVWNAQIPIAVFCDDNAVRFFNGTSLEADSLCISEIKSIPLQECDEESDFSFWNISNPLFWGKYSKAYSQGRLNQSLLDNISYLTDQLRYKYNIEFATKLVLRLIFIRYLIDRGVDLDYEGFGQDIEESQKQFLEILSNKDAIYDFFAHLKTKFNGNLFELGNEIESINLTDNVFRLLQRFFAGDEKLENGQYCLFKMYDFNLIPIELISNMYEILLGENGREKDNAFYTPNYLVEYILDNVTNATLKAKKQFSILDPACGSGVFLVNSYRRIVEEFLGGEQYCKDDELLKRLLTDNIFGVDINPSAVDVTIFSLYLTVLDYKNPKTLKSFRLPNLKGSNLFVGDFFDEKKMKILEGKKFDYIIGNPPWGNVKTGMHLAYCKEHGYGKMQQNNEICRSFVFRAQDFAQDERTACCFILHSKIFYNKQKPALKFREFLLNSVSIDMMLELSAVRKLIFEHANAPAAVLSFRFSNKMLDSNRIKHITVMPNLFHRLFHVLVVEKHDIKYVPQKLLKNNDWVWKTVLFGTSFDVSIISNLKEKYDSLKDALEKLTPKIRSINGIQYLDGKEDATYLKGRKFLTSGIDHFLIHYEQLKDFDKDKIHRARLKNKDVFEPPYVVLAKGLDMNNYKMKGAYSERSFVSSDAIFVFKGDKEQRDSLYNIEALLNSSLYAYFNIMLGSSVGIEREQRLMGDVYEYPYVFSETSVKIVGDMHLKKDNVQNMDTLQAIQLLDSAIMKEFGLDGNVFVDYVLNIRAKELLNKDVDRSYRRVQDADLMTYSKCFYEHFTMIYNRVNKYIRINMSHAVESGYAVIELEVSDKEDEQGVFVANNVDTEKEMLSKYEIYAYNEKFYQMRDVVYFTSNSFYIIKPDRYKYWHPAMAEIDLADVIDQIMSADRGVEL